MNKLKVNCNLGENTKNFVQRNIENTKIDFLKNICCF